MKQVAQNLYAALTGLLAGALGHSTLFHFCAPEPPPRVIYADHAKACCDQCPCCKMRREPQK